jgi:hypothetical protein
MKSEPSVCCLALYADRPQFAKRLVESFWAQTYPNARLLVYDTGKEPFPPELGLNDSIDLHREYTGLPRTVGQLRNNALSLVDADIVCHWDSDDWSHPNRIAEQVALLQSGKWDAVGYREMLFWDSRVVTGLSLTTGPTHAPKIEVTSAGQAWLYSNKNPAYIQCGSLCYWRETWQKKAFPDVMMGEGPAWCAGFKTLGVTSVLHYPLDEPAHPRLIAEIHGANTSNAYNPVHMAAVERQRGEWSRVPEWDTYCRGVMR